MPVSMDRSPGTLFFKCCWLDDTAALSHQFGQGPYTRDGSVLLNDVFGFKDAVAMVAEEVNIECGILVE